MLGNWLRSLPDNSNKAANLARRLVTAAEHGGPWKYDKSETEKL